MTTQPNPWIPPGMDNRTREDQTRINRELVKLQTAPDFLDKVRLSADEEARRLREEQAVAEPPSAWDAELEEVVALQLARRAAERAQEGPPSSWEPVDLEPVLSGTYEPPEATVGRRADGQGLFYPGRLHAVVAESEGGKTWLALTACLDEMNAGRNVLYLDFEDDEGGIIGRLLTMGATGSAVRNHFTYLRPDQAVTAHLVVLEEILLTRQPSLAVLDGVTEAMVLHGLNPLDNVDISKFATLLTRRLAAAGAAVVVLDHVTKDRESRGRYALGAVHKLNGLNGAQYVLENREPFGRGMLGRSTLRIAKDRPGQLRQAGVSSSGGMHWFGDLVVDSRGQLAEVSVEVPITQEAGDFRPTFLMSRISDAFEQHGDMAQRTVLDLVTGKSTATKRQAFALLIADGYLTAATPHHLIKPFRHADE